MPYYAKHDDKNFIRRKSVRFSLKLCQAYTLNGSLLFAESYCTSHNRVIDNHAGGTVVLESVEQLQVRMGQHVVCNIFLVCIIDQETE